MGKKKELALGYGDSALLAYWHAQDFKEAAEYICEKEPSRPVVVNLAFSCELYMKALLMLQRKTREIIIGHELNQLFSELNEDIRERILRETNIRNWDRFMKDSSNAFEAWRYFYEKDKAMIGHIPELFRLADMLDKICAETFSIKENQNG